MSAYRMGNQQRQTAVMSNAHLDLRYEFSNNLPNILAQQARLQQSYKPINILVPYILALS